MHSLFKYLIFSWHCRTAKLVMLEINFHQIILTICRYVPSFLCFSLVPDSIINCRLYYWCCNEYQSLNALMSAPWNSNFLAFASVNILLSAARISETSHIQRSCESHKQTQNRHIANIPSLNINQTGMISIFIVLTEPKINIIYKLHNFKLACVYPPLSWFNV